jgi:hypothetical protein
MSSTVREVQFYCAIKPDPCCLAGAAMTTILAGEENGLFEEHTHWKLMKRRIHSYGIRHAHWHVVTCNCSPGCQ